jgi:hypothetical protein
MQPIITKFELIATYLPATIESRASHSTGKTTTFDSSACRRYEKRSGVDGVRARRRLIISVAKARNLTVLGIRGGNHAWNV